MNVGWPFFFAGSALALASLVAAGCSDHAKPGGENAARSGQTLGQASGQASGQGGPPKGGPSQGGQGQSAQGPGGPGRPGGRGATQVVAALVESRTFVTRIEAIGTLEPRERVELTANASDRITALYFEDGQRVRRGVTLVTLASEEEQAQLEAAQARLADTKRQLERNLRLAESDAVSEQELQRSTREADSAAADVRAVEARLRDRVLVAPFSGVLGFRKVSVGAYVSPGQPVATLIDDREMRLEFAVPSIHIGALAVGQEIEGTTADIAGRVFRGKVTSIDNAIDPVTRTVRVRATLPNDDHLLRAGMFLTVELLAAAKTAPAIPEISVIAEGSETFVFKVDATKQPPVAIKSPVTLGVRERGVVEVLEGLVAGDQIVTDGVLKVRPNAPLRLIANEGGARGPVAAAGGPGSPSVGMSQ